MFASGLVAWQHNVNDYSGDVVKVVVIVVVVVVVVVVVLVVVVVVVVAIAAVAVVIAPVAIATIAVAVAILLATYYRVVEFHTRKDPLSFDMKNVTFSQTKAPMVPTLYLVLTLLLNHWGRVTHICVSKLTIIGSDNGLSPGRRQAII